MTDAALFTADLTAPGRPLHQPWQWCVGSGHATLALRADWQAQLAQARRDLGFRHVRFHGILDDDMGTLICQDDKPLYSGFMPIDSRKSKMRSVLKKEYSGLSS